MRFLLRIVSVCPIVGIVFSVTPLRIAHGQCQAFESAKLTASNADPQDTFGTSVSMDGNVVVVGAPSGDAPNMELSGTAYVFRFDGSNWIEEQLLSASDASFGGAFGFSVSVSGDAILIGAQIDSKSCPAKGTQCGAAYVFRHDGNTWLEEAKLTASDAAANDRFGYSVSLDGDVGIVGAFLGDSPSMEDSGAAYVFRYDGSR